MLSDFTQKALSRLAFDFLAGKKWPFAAALTDMPADEIEQRKKWYLRNTGAKLETLIKREEFTKEEAKYFLKMVRLHAATKGFPDEFNTAVWSREEGRS